MPASTLVWWPINPTSLNPEQQQFLAWPIVPLSILVFLQLNSEVVLMILTMKANREAVKEAFAQGQAKTQAEVMAWYEANKDKMSDVAPPDFSQNGKN